LYRGFREVVVAFSFSREQVQAVLAEARKGENSMTKTQILMKKRYLAKFYIAE
jgi:hypothetical protein